MQTNLSERKKSRVEVAYLALRQAIIEQALEPGTKLPEDAIGSSFDMSRTLARKVLIKLQYDGLVEVKRKRSATVARPSLSDAQEVFRVRKCLEREVVRQICQHWNNEMKVALEEHIRAEDQAAETNNNALSIRLAGEFHILLAELSGNHLLKKYVDEVVSRCSLILALYARPHSSQCAVIEHRELLKAFSKKDSPRALELMDEHLGSVENRAMIPASSPAKRDLMDVIQSYADQINND